MDEKLLREINDIIAPLYGEHLVMRAVLVELLRAHPVDLNTVRRMIDRMDTQRAVRYSADLFLEKLEQQLSAE